MFLCILFLFTLNIFFNLFNYQIFNKYKYIYINVPVYTIIYKHYNITGLYYFIALSIQLKKYFFHPISSQNTVILRKWFGRMCAWCRWLTATHHCSMGYISTDIVWVREWASARARVCVRQAVLRKHVCAFVGAYVRICPVNISITFMYITKVIIYIGIRNNITLVYCNVRNNLENQYVCIYKWS